MPEEHTLLEDFRQTKYQISGHGRRQVHILQEALSEIDGQLDADIYGTGPIIEDFQRKIAEFLGKPAAVFFPSGTMAQQIGLRIWCDQTGLKKVAYHPLCHLEIHEEYGMKALHQIEAVILADEDRLITLNDVVNMPEKVSAVLLELPQREIGGQLPAFEELEAISAYCRDHGIRLHLDGARLFEVLPYYQKTAAEVCALFDSVYVSFYKGIGAIAGAILAGPHEFIHESKIWKRRHGGDLISLYPYILSANYYFDERIGKMGQYYAQARELARSFNACRAVATLPAVPVSNMFHVHCARPKGAVEPLLSDIYRTTGIGLTGSLVERGHDSCSFEVSVGDQYDTIPKPQLQKVFAMLDAGLSAQMA